MKIEQFEEQTGIDIPNPTGPQQPQRIVSDGRFYVYGRNVDLDHVAQEHPSGMFYPWISLSENQVEWIKNQKQ